MCLGGPHFNAFRGPVPAHDIAAKVLGPAARRALEEADARRKAQGESAAPREIGGPPGPEPTRYGDWERKGIASDF